MSIGFRPLFLAVGLCLALTFPVAAEDGLVPYSEGDPRMNAAILEAQRTLPLFLAAALDPEGRSRPGYVVKVAFPTTSDPAGREHIWVAPFAQLSDGRFTGYLDNEPNDLGDLRMGDLVPFNAAMITDWGALSESGVSYGQFTTRVIFEDGAFGDTPFEQVFEPDPVPAEWK